MGTGVFGTGVTAVVGVGVGEGGAMVGVGVGALVTVGVGDGTRVGTTVGVVAGFPVTGVVATAGPGVTTTPPAASTVIPRHPDGATGDDRMNATAHRIAPKIRTIRLECLGITYPSSVLGSFSRSPISPRGTFPIVSNPYGARREKRSVASVLD